MSTDTYAETTTERVEPALLDWARAEARQIGDIAAGSLYAALVGAAENASIGAANQWTEHAIDPPVAFATGLGSLHAIDAVRVTRSLGYSVNVNPATFEETTSPHVEVHVTQINEDGAPASGRCWWANLDGQLDAADVAALFPAADFGDTTDEDDEEDEEPILSFYADGSMTITGTVADLSKFADKLAEVADLAAADDDGDCCDGDCCIEDDGVTIDGTLNASMAPTSVVINLGNSGQLSREDIADAVADGIRATRRAPVIFGGVRI